MAKFESIPRRRRLPTYTGRLMIDVVRGVIRVRKWPRKRGPPKSASQRYWIDWFKQANLLAKYADPMSQIRAKELTAHTGMYPRDIMLAAMRGRLYSWVDSTGWRWYPVAAIQDISESLDVLAQTVGSILVRATDRWRDAEPGAPGDVLTHQAANTPPKWVTPTGGGGYLGGALVSKSANQSIPNNAATKISWDQETYDTTGIHDNAVNNTRLTVPVGFNRVRCSAGAYWASNNNLVRQLFILKNGGYPAGTPVMSSEALYNSQAIVAGPIVEVVAGDYFELMVYQNRGGSLNFMSNNQSWFSMDLISAT